MSNILGFAQEVFWIDGTSWKKNEIIIGNPFDLEFPIINKGVIPLLLTSAQSPSNECSLDYPKSPLKKGVRAVVKITCDFKKSKQGYFNRTFLLKSNDGIVHKLNISGFLISVKKKLEGLSDELLMNEILPFYLKALEETKKIEPSYFHGCKNFEENSKHLRPTDFVNSLSEKRLDENPLYALKVKIGFKITVSLNPLETELFKRYPEQTTKLLYLGAIAKEKSEEIYSEKSSYLGDGDAFRHGYWNALLAKYVNADFAKAWTTAREMKGVQADNGEMSIPDFDAKNSEAFMDMLNNNIGRTIGKINHKLTDDELVSYIQKQVARGKLYKVQESDGKLVPTGN